MHLPPLKKEVVTIVIITNTFFCNLQKLINQSFIVIDIRKKTQLSNDEHEEREGSCEWGTSE